MDNINLTKKEIEAFLHFGYVPQPKGINVDALFARYNIDLNSGNSIVEEAALIADGAKFLDIVFCDTAKKVKGKKIVVPISGGMDSRAILAGLIRYIPKENIQTVTLGIPGALDYEIGQMVARKAGVENKLINLNNIMFSEEELIRYARNFNKPIALLEGYLFSQAFKSFGNGHVYLSGFMGDPIAGSHLAAEGNETWNDAIRTFICENLYTRMKFNFTDLSLFPQEPFVGNNTLEYAEQLDYFVRQRLYIMPLVLLSGYKHFTPFLDSRWVNFILNVPRNYRKGQYIYKKILFFLYPDLFSLPLKSNVGLPLDAGDIAIFRQRVINKFRYWGYRYAPRFFPKSIQGLNYIDFERGYREKDDLVKLAEKSLIDLKLRGIVENIDIQKVWKEHQAGNVNNSQLISLLIALEVFCKAKE